MKAKFLFLGTGASAGVPLIGCQCSVCTSSSEKDRRLRPSGLLQIDGKNILIDTTPDFRTQALRSKIDKIDALLLTHTHFDHIAGIDDLRIFNIRQKGPIPCFLSKDSFQQMQKRYDYLFDETKATAKFDFSLLENKSGLIDVSGIEVGYFHYWQTDMLVTGFKIGDFAYMTDIKKFDDLIFSFLEGVDQLVISALRPETSTFHIGFEEAIGFCQKAKVNKGWVTHLSHADHHESYNSLLGKGVKAAYDGLEIEFTCTK